mmetsp:Transcript_69208/g.144274  ORF Transcript_69208/g.144274 Transcript_69208/m.144274 type:complete len:273 (+) Transcript_69208:140-958(+)
MNLDCVFVAIDNCHLHATFTVARHTCVPATSDVGDGSRPTMQHVVVSAPRLIHYLPVGLVGEVRVVLELCVRVGVVGAVVGIARVGAKLVQQKARDQARRDGHRESEDDAQQLIHPLVVAVHDAGVVTFGGLVCCQHQTGQRSDQTGHAVEIVHAAGVVDTEGVHFFFQNVEPIGRHSSATEADYHAIRGSQSHVAHRTECDASCQGGVLDVDGAQLPRVGENHGHGEGCHSGGREGEHRAHHSALLLVRVGLQRGGVKGRPVHPEENRADE